MKQEKFLNHYGDINQLDEHLALYDESGKLLGKEDLIDTVRSLTKEILLNTPYKHIVKEFFNDLYYTDSQNISLDEYEKFLDANILTDTNFSALWDMPETPLAHFSSALYCYLNEIDLTKTDVSSFEKERVMWLLSQMILCCIALHNFQKNCQNNLNVTITYTPKKYLIKKAYLKSDYINSEGYNFFPNDTWNDNCIVCMARFVVAVIIESC